ncbi:MAG: ParB/RepB/Spo0J family partition protein [Bacteroidetes bacterium]|jgi:ParB family chromosome partitioning protein|nr:ParB/RepB/Spo0J family partition protein [Bacteroidota bacterium]
MSQKKNDLGKGIRALLEGMNSDAEGDFLQKKKVQQMASTNNILLENIELNPFQPRADFDETALQELSASIKIHGVIQPITVRNIGTNKYQLISGERRVRASKLAGLKEIPAFVRATNDQEMLEIALIENIQREDLNAIEVAIHFRRLLDECNLTHEALAERVGKNRTTVTNFLRLLKLPPDLQRGLKEKKMTMGHARALIALEDPAGQIAIYMEILSKNLSVRDVEEMVRNYNNKKVSVKQKTVNALPYEIRKVQDTLASRLATRVQIKRDKQGKGEMVISFFSDDDLFRLKELIED